MEDLPLEVLRDLWLARFGPVVTWDEAVYVTSRNKETHWSEVYQRLSDAGHTVLLFEPIRIAINQEKM